MFNHIEIEKTEQLFKEQTIPVMDNNIHKNTSMIKILIPYFLLIGATFQILMIFSVKCVKFVN